MALTIKDGLIVYLPHTGIYRYNSTTEQYETLYGNDIPVSNRTDVLAHIPIAQDVLDKLGFTFCGNHFNLGVLKVDYNETPPHYTINGTPIDDFSDLHAQMIKQGMAIDYQQFLTALSKGSSKP